MSYIFRIFVIIFITLFSLSSYAEDNSSDKNKFISIEKSLYMARNNYPLSKNKDLIAKSLEYNINNLNKGYIPDIRFFAKATYQSDVPDIDMNSLGIPFPMPKKLIDLTKDQYQIYGEISQLLYDGSKIYNTKKIVRSKSKIEEAELDKMLYNIQASVINVYFGILLLYEQAVQTDIHIAELNQNYTKIENYVKNGVANETDLDLIKVEQTIAINRLEDINIKIRKSYNILSEFIGEDATKYTLLIPDDNAELELLKNKTAGMYDDNSSNKSYDILKNSPELISSNMMIEELDAEKDNTISDMLPRIDLFIQGGFSKPGLNMFKNDFVPYYVGGIRFNWRITGFYSYNSGLKLLDIQKQQIQSQKLAFIFNTKIKINELFQDIETLQNRMKADDDIIKLRNSIKNSAESKVQNGVISVNDLLTDINKLNLARQDKSLHKIELVMKIYELKNILNEW